MVYRFFLIAAFLWSSGANALSLSTAKAPHVEAELIAESQSIQPGQEFWVAVSLTMESGWHTYWKNPGDTGLPTKISWHLAPGFSASEIHWPSPEHFDLAQLTNYGYEGEVLLLTKITAPRTLSAKSVSIGASVNWLVCKEQCIPGSVELELRLPVSAAKPKLNQIERTRFDRARSSIPREWPESKVFVHQTEEEIALQLQGVGTLPKGAKIEFFPASQGLIQSQEEQVALLDKDGTLVVIMKKGDGDIPQLSGEVVIRSAKESFSIAINQSIAGVSGDPGSLWQLLIFAFLGGLILNLMPCVLPVLGMKILSLLNKTSKEKAHARAAAWIYTLGVLVSFWILSGVLFLLRASGEQLGWGFQLQSPWFLVAMILLFSFLALHLLGFVRFGERFAGLGSGLAARDGWVGSFFTGVLAVVVASPCTAPFMGAALGAALLQSTWVGFLIFTFLGLGLALPFLLFSYFPGAWKVLPKPGPWMERLKKFMAVPMLATVLWLLWVLVQQIGPTTVSQASTQAVQWENYSEKKLQSTLASGRTVFIDFTAAWCLSCHVNERLVLNTEEVQRAFIAAGVVALRADWTNRNPEITKALESYSRLGVPLYVLYRRGSKKPVILPQVLTTGVVLKELQRK